MKNTLLIGLALLSFAACKKETEVKTQDTIIETGRDTVRIDTDTISDANSNVTPVTPEKAVDASSKRVDKPENLAKKEILPAAKDNSGDFAAFGDKIAADKALTKEQMYSKYKNLKAGDTVAVKFKTQIKDVCQKKGCWMSLQLPEEKESFVKFKDYAFFVPLNATGQDAIVSGKAFVSETSVAQLRHYAKDGGESEAEINKITEPKRTYGFLADGVLISK